jgi:transcriptional regulator with XRE-family HTH domain
MSQEAVAFAAGISTSSVSRIERALMNPPWTVVRQMAEVLGVSIAELAAGVEREDSKLHSDTAQADHRNA